MSDNVIEKPSIVDATVAFIKAREGYIYGEGAAALAGAIYAKLAPMPRITGKDLDGAERIADAILEVLAEASANIGQRADIECGKRREGDGWRISWESGPYEWAIQASFLVYEATGRLCEPYYGFDLCIYDVE